MKSGDRLALFTRKSELSPGDSAPDFELAGSDGRIYRLRDLAGRPVVVAWFPKAFTGG
jgi:peroxiredoxin Q/BCP